MTAERDGDVVRSRFLSADEHQREQRGKHELRAGFRQLVDDDDADAGAIVETHLFELRIQSANCSPNIGKPLLDSAFVASS